MTACSVHGCGREVAARGWCMTHYAWSRRHGWAEPTYKIRRLKPGAKCHVTGCDKPRVARGRCNRHYVAAWRKEHAAG